MKTSSFVEELGTSPIREIAALLQKQLDDPELIKESGGEPSFIPPEWLLNEACSLLKKEESHKYTATAGLPKVRESIVNYLNERKGLDVKYENVMLQPCGATSGIVSSLYATVNPGDEIIIFVPIYPCYPAMIENFVRAKAVRIYTQPKMDFNIEEFKKRIGNKTKATIIISPDNPTGRVLTKEQMRAIGDLSEDHHFVIIHDEAYNHYDYTSDDRHPSFWELGFRENSIGIGSASKFADDPQERLGLSYSPSNLVNEMEKINGYLYLCPSALSQLTFKAWLDNKEKRDEYVEMVKKTYHERMKALTSALRKNLPECKFRYPEGAFYVFANLGAYTKGRPDKEIAKDMIQKIKVSTVNGSAFGVDPIDGYFRLTFVSEHANRLEESTVRMANYFGIK